MKCIYALSVFVSVVLGPTVYALDYTPRGDAQWMLERVTGVKWPADTPILDEMTHRISNGDRAGAADLAMTLPQFLNVTVKQFALQMSTHDENVLAPFNDFTAAFMGVTRDNTDARELLYGNFYYKADPSKVTLTKTNMVADFLNSNNHYLELAGRRDIDLGESLLRVDGQMILGAGNAAVANPDPAGVITSRSFLGSHSIMGTNRRMVEYTFREFMCVKMADWSDTSASDIRIGRDISRAPGGDTTKFQSSCKGCHTGMDGFRGAFAKWDFRGDVMGAGFAGYVGTSSIPAGEVDGQVAKKMNRPTFIEYPGGFVTTDDSWINNARGPANATRFGWGSDVSGGKGVNSFGRLIAGSVRFPQCMAKRVWASVCKYELPSDAAETLYVSLGMAFATGGYKLKDLYRVVASHPKCRQ